MDRKVDAKELKHPYRQLARKWHPDLNRDNPELAEKKMTEINVAYSVRLNEVSRIVYDKNRTLRQGNLYKRVYKVSRTNPEKTPTIFRFWLEN